MTQKEILIQHLQNAINEIEKMPDDIAIYDSKSNKITEIYFSDIEEKSVIMYIG